MDTLQSINIERFRSFQTAQNDNRFGEKSNEELAGEFFGALEKFEPNAPFNFREWSQLLDLPESTFRRHVASRKPFDGQRSLLFAAIISVIEQGKDVFEDEKKFFRWLFADIIALGRVAPRKLLNNFYGIQLVSDELGRIEYGILA